MCDNSAGSVTAGIRRNLFLVGALVLSNALAGCGKQQTSSGPAAVVVSNHLAAIAAAREPVTLEQLNRSYAEPPAAQNAAPLFEQAFAALRAEGANSPA